jgi:hypothetical protein
MQLSEMKEIFYLVAKRIEEKKESLRGLKEHRCMGLEGWLKVEAVAALGEKVRHVRSRGADLEFESGNVELKAATNFDSDYVKEGAMKYNAPCLFPGDGNNKENIDKIKIEKDIEIVALKLLKDGGEKWVIGMVRPAQVSK